jgi:predicted O-linked N-acetylglucosamine transferase (SPINDLY family)
VTSAYEDAIALRDTGRFAEAEAKARAWLAETGDDGPGRALLRHLLLLQARVATPADPAAAVDLAREMAGLIGPPALGGADEGARLQRAVEMVLEVLPRVPPRAKASAANILRRAGDHAAADSLGSLAEIGRAAAAAGDAHALLRQLARVEGDADRREVLAQHRAWAARLEAAAAARPIARRPRRGGERLRLGFLSSDLRVHVVAYFVHPLFQEPDPRFELFTYSAWPGAADPMAQWFAGRAAAARRLPADDHDAAQMIADDGLDLLIELGGPTAWSRPGVLAYRPAPLQASWLGYPQSLGLAAIDHFIADPYVLPPRREFLLEAPLMLPRCWIAMTPAAFQPQPALTPQPPMLRNGFVTFGTANDPYKFTPAALAAWARIVAATPGSRFMIVRPECGAPAFREHVARAFAAEGVDAGRLDFRPVRGGVRPHYADMDIALDSFPVTGGTTTCEALWMGVPTVTLVGEAPYERLGWSIVNNAGLAELGATTVDGFVETAVRLAGDPDRLTRLRATMRERILAHPLGQPEAFARDFYDLVANAIAQAQAE